MRWLNFCIPLMSGQPFINAPSEDVGVWWRLMVYCGAKENGGVILHCEDWTEIAWMRSVGVSKQEILRESSLWTFREPPFAGLVVAHYPREQEAACKAKRAGGKAGAKKRWRRKPKNVLEMPVDSQQENG